MTNTLTAIQLTHTLPFALPGHSTMLVLSNGAVPDASDPQLWQDYLGWQKNISDDDLFSLIIEESKPTFAPLTPANRQAFFEMLGPRLPEHVQTLYTTCPFVITVSCSAPDEAFISASFWGSLTFAAFLASCSDGIVIDVSQCKAFEPSNRLLRSHNSAIPFTDPFLSVIGLEKTGAYDLKSRGNARFGLPEVMMLDISENHTGLAAMVMRTYGQQLWTEIEIARQFDPAVRQIAVPQEINSQYAPGIYGSELAHVRHFSIPIEWSAQASEDGDPVVVLSPSRDEGTWDEWFESYGELLLALKEAGQKQVDSEGYDMPAQEAREALPAVLARYAAGELGNGELYFRCPFLTSDSDPPEFIWLRVKNLTAGGFTGEVRNKSLHDETLQVGTILQLTLDEVFDWIVEYPDGKIEGGYGR